MNMKIDIWKIWVNNYYLYMWMDYLMVCDGSSKRFIDKLDEISHKVFDKKYVKNR